MILLLVFMQLTHDLFAIAKFLFYVATLSDKHFNRWIGLKSLDYSSDDFQTASRTQT